MLDWMRTEGINSAILGANNLKKSKPKQYSCGLQGGSLERVYIDIYTIMYENTWLNAVTD